MRRARPPRTGRGLTGRLLDATALLLFGGFLAAALPQALQLTGIAIWEAAYTQENLEDARARSYGAEYSRAIDNIRAALPVDEGYILVEGGRPGSGGVYWVRYDLAPRPAANVGPLAELTGGADLRRRLSANLRHVVVAYDTRKPPRLYDRYRFVEELERRARKGPG